MQHLQTELPPDYVELEKRVDALKQAHQKMLAVTSVSPSPAIPTAQPPTLTMDGNPPQVPIHK